MRTTEQLVKMARKLSETAERLPGATLVQREYEVIEDAMLQSLHKRLRRAVARVPGNTGLLEAPGPNGRASPLIDDVEFVDEERAPGSLAQRLQAAMDEALEQTMEQAAEAWAHRVLDQLLADELRIISALSDDSRHAAIEVSAAPSLTGQREILLSGLSSITKPARIKVRHLLPGYLSNLHAMGLLEYGPVAAEHELEYQVLEADSEVIRVTAEAQRAGYYRIRCDRQTLRISTIGRRFWELCNP